LCSRNLCFLCIRGWKFRGCSLFCIACIVRAIDRTERRPL
jgi:hypothetical protein